MTYGQVKNAALKLLNQYSMAGQLVADSYNNQQDYINRIPELVNDAMVEIANVGRKIPMMLELKNLAFEDLGNQVRYTLPHDFLQFKSGGVVKTVDGRLLHTNVYMVQGGSYLVLPKEEAGDYTIEYYRQPILLGDDPDDRIALDNDPLTHRAIPYYVAAFLVSHDEPFLYQTFYNKYEDLLARMRPDPYASVTTVEDVYGGGW